MPDFLGNIFVVEINSSSVYCPEFEKNAEGAWYCRGAGPEACSVTTHPQPVSENLVHEAHNQLFPQIYL